MVSSPCVQDVVRSVICCINECCYGSCCHSLGKNESYSQQFYGKKRKKKGGISINAYFVSKEKSFPWESSFVYPVYNLWKLEIRAVNGVCANEICNCEAVWMFGACLVTIINSFCSTSLMIHVYNSTDALSLIWWFVRLGCWTLVHVLESLPSVLYCI